MTTKLYDCKPTVIDTYAATGNADNGYVSTTTFIRKSNKLIIILEIQNQVGGQGGAFACNLPTNSEIGDIVEIYSNNGGSFFNAPSGETFVNDITNLAQTIVGINGSGILRKISDSQWGCVRGS